METAHSNWLRLRSKRRGATKVSIRPSYVRRVKRFGKPYQALARR